MTNIEATESKPSRSRIRPKMACKLVKEMWIRATGTSNPWTSLEKCWPISRKNANQEDRGEQKHWITLTLESCHSRIFKTTELQKRRRSVTLALTRLQQSCSNSLRIWTCLSSLKQGKSKSNRLNSSSNLLLRLETHSLELRRLWLPHQLESKCGEWHEISLIGKTCSRWAHGFLSKLSDLNSRPNGSQKFWTWPLAFCLLQFLQDLWVHISW